MRAERRHLSSILLRLARKLNKGEYIDYYLREGYQAQDAGQVRPEQLQVEAVYDIFSQLKKILSSAGTCKQVPAIYNRSRFVLNFFQLLADGELKMSVDCSSRESQMNSKYQHGKEHFYRTRYPLLSQKVYHLDYFGELYESELLNSARP